MVTGGQRGRGDAHWSRWRRYHIHNDDDRMVRLRGGPVFDMWRVLGHDVETFSAGEVRTPAVVYTATPGTPDTAATIEQWHARPDILVVVDVPFPLGRPDAMAGNAEAMAFWTDPVAQESAFRAVRAADAVTVPWPEWDGYPGWIDDIAEHQPNVVVVPDLADDPDGDDMLRYATQLMRVWSQAWRWKGARG